MCPQCENKGEFYSSSKINPSVFIANTLCFNLKYDFIYGHLWIRQYSAEIQLNIYFACKDGEIAFSQQNQEPVLIAVPLQKIYK